uniref:MLLT10 histone lysine methyltransferase DOT1L cofactor n=1 Tax=Poecilia formosa TaxID=48698 RepID=A0A096M118_POEFO
MVCGERCLTADVKLLTSNMKEMIGGCCVCSDERGWAENPLVYCDGHGCNVAVHQACYGIVQVPTGPWFCRKCESQERAARVRCELCPHKDGALKRTDNGGWAHVVCALYIPEVEFANVSTMEPIVLQSVPHERYNKTCYICEEQGRESKAATGACMTCNKHGCRQAFHVTCAQFAGLLCEEQGSDADNVKYCGYCKYHHSKLRRSRGRGSRSQSLSDSSSQSMDRPTEQNKKKHKERDRHKPKHKKGSMDMSPSLVLPNIMVPEKAYNSTASGGGVTSLPASSQKRLDDNTGRFTNANFQEVSSALSVGASKDGLAADTIKAAAEGKNKKNSGGAHTVGQRGGRKSLTSSGKPLPSAVVTMATSSTSASASTGPFHQVEFFSLLRLLLTSSSKTPAAPSSSDFLSFTDPSLRPGSGTSFSSPPSFSSCLVKSSSEGGASEGTTPLFGSLMSATTTSAGTAVIMSSSSSINHAASETTSLAGSTGYKRSQPAGSGLGMGAGVTVGGEEGVKKKKKGNWRNRFGPCFTTDAKPTEAAPSLTLPTSSSAASATSSSSSTASTASSKSPSLLRNGGLQSNSGSTTAGSELTGTYFNLNRNSCVSEVLFLGVGNCGLGVFSVADGSSSGTAAVAMGGASAELSQQQQPTPSLAPPSPFTAAAPLNSTTSAHIQALPGSVFNLAPPHMFGNRLNPNSSMAALIAQSEASPADADQEVGDGSSGSQGFSIRASPKTTPRSPIGGLQIRYDSSGSLPGPGLGLLGAGGVGGGETLPPVATSIEQLLERQWNEGQSFLLQQGAQGDVVAMLKSLHQLQEENRRLEEQIKTLTMKKERLQLLSAQLSVPFTPSTVSSDNKRNNCSLLCFGLSLNKIRQSDMKGSHLGATDSSLPMTAQDTASCGGHSSSGSTSSLSASPSVSQSPPQPALNGMAATAALGGVAGLMGALGAGNALGIGGIVGALNGVIQAPAAGPSSPHTTGTTAGVSLPVNSRRCCLWPRSAARLGLLSEQQRLLQHQLQQLLSSQSSAVRHSLGNHFSRPGSWLQSLSSTAQMPSMPLSGAQLPIANLQSQGAIAANPFLALRSGPGKPRVAEKAAGITGQEKT